MAKDKEFNEYVVNDLLAGIPGVTSRAMFGGYGIYKEGVIFAIIFDGQLGFKVGDANRADFERYKSKPFMYEMKNGKSVEMGYWNLPEAVMEDSDLLKDWVKKALAVSKAAKAAKKK